MRFPRAAVVIVCTALAACNDPPPVNDFRDLNKNGELDVYEDARMTVEARIDDLLQ